MVFIELLLLSRGLPQSDTLIALTFLVVANLKDQRVKPFSYPADRTVLLWNIRALVEIVWRAKISCASSKPMPHFGFALNRMLFRRPKWNRIEGITVISFRVTHLFLSRPSQTLPPAIRPTAIAFACTTGPAGA
jgi:hypothetical protein